MAKLIIGFYVLAFIASIVIIIVLIDRRIRIKKQEDFEDRDN